VISSPARARRANTPVSEWANKKNWQKYTQRAQDQLAAMGLWPPPYPEWTPTEANLTKAPKQARYQQALTYKFGDRSFWGLSEQATPKMAQFGLAQVYTRKKAQRENLARLAGGGRQTLLAAFGSEQKTLLGQ
jgi:hypothetical protein